MNSKNTRTEQHNARGIYRIAMPAAVVAVGLVIMVLMIFTRPKAQVVQPTTIAVPVTAMTVSARDVPLTIQATGTVMAAREVSLQAEVTGRAVRVNTEMVPGGRVSEGETLIWLDDRDYTAAVRQREAAVEGAVVGLQTELGQKAIAEREWNQFGNIQTDSMGRALALREPQLRQAQAELEAARSALDLARLQVERTRITAPFDAVVRSESVDVGQIVRSGSTLANLVASDMYWIQVPVSLSDLRWLEIPGASAAITLDLGGNQQAEWTGRVTRVLSDVESVGMLAQLLVEVERPLDSSTQPLLLGAPVNVALQGQTVTGVYELPRAALRSNDKVWLVNGDEVLDIRDVHVIYRLPETVIVRGDLPTGSLLVTSSISAPASGMHVDVRQVEGEEPAVLGSRAERSGGAS